MSPMPRDPRPDSSLALLADPYGYVPKTCRRFGRDVFEARLLLKPTICMSGAEAAELFYDPQRFVRRDAAPRRLVHSLFGKGGVQTLDDAAHRHRKQLFLSLMSRERIDALVRAADAQWTRHAQGWCARSRVVLYDEAQEVLGRAVCDWAGVPVAEAVWPKRLRDLVALFDGAGAVGPWHWAARAARKRCDRWIAHLIEQSRDGRLHLPVDSAAHAVASHRDLDSELLPTRVAAVELVNLLRPTIAVSVYVVFVALALEEFPEWRVRLQDADAADDDATLRAFVQEVRRVYPFFPAVAARVREDFEWRGYRFPKGRRVMLDLYGTGRDPRRWPQPEAFMPERFLSRAPGAYELIPQGGGDHAVHHRCPGEWITIELMVLAARRLVRMRYALPPQDLRIDAKRLPALPRSRFVMAEVRV